MSTEEEIIKKNQQILELKKIQQHDTVNATVKRIEDKLLGRSVSGKCEDRSLKITEFEERK